MKTYFEVRLGRKEEPGPTMRGGAGMPEHVTNFLECVRTRKQPNASAEVAHLTCSLVHLGEIGYRVGRVPHFDPATGRFRNDDEANAMLTKEYRKLWVMPETVNHTGSPCTRISKNTALSHMSDLWPYSFSFERVPEGREITLPRKACQTAIALAPRRWPTAL